MNLALIRPKGFPGVDDYFDHFPVMTMGTTLAGSSPFPVQNFQIDRTLSLQGIGRWIFDSRLQKGDSVVIVSHGTKDQISLPMGEGATKPMNLATLTALNDTLDIDNPDQAALSKLAVTFGMKKSATETVGLMLDYFNFIRDIGLNHIAIRACNIGQTLPVLQQITALFRSRSVSAPVKRDFFGQTKVDYISTEEMDRRQKNHPNDYYFGESPYRISISYEMTGHSSASMNFRAESSRKPETGESVARFMKAKFEFTQKSQYQIGDKLALHGVWNEGVKPYFFFPKDADYAGNLRTWVEPLYLIDNPVPPHERPHRLRKLVGRIKERLHRKR